MPNTHVQTSEQVNTGVTVFTLPRELGWFNLKADGLLEAT